MADQSIPQGIMGEQQQPGQPQQGNYVLAMNPVAMPGNVTSAAVPPVIMVQMQVPPVGSQSLQMMYQPGQLAAPQAFMGTNGMVQLTGTPLPMQNELQNTNSVPLAPAVPLLVPALSNLPPVTSSGELVPLVNPLPLVKAPVAPSSFQETQPTASPEEQVKECAGVIQEALQHPQLAPAGQVMLQAMQASSTYMTSLIEENKVEENKVDMKQVPPAGQVPYKKFFLTDDNVQMRASDTSLTTSAPKEVVSSFSGSSPVLSTASAALNPPRVEPLVPILNTSSSTSVGPEVFSAMYNASQAPSSLSSTALAAPPILPRPLSPPVSAQDAALTARTKTRPFKASCGKVEKARHPKPHELAFERSPHEYLLTILKERGFPSETISSFEAGYQAEPSPLQLASFGTLLVKAVHSDNVEALDALLGCGLSANPCNSFGDSILSLVCKRADYGVFKCLVGHGCDLQVCDSWGRTPLHHTACSGTFSKEIAKVILDRDLNQLLVEDKVGKCPLEYVRKDQRADCCAFLQEVLDVYWPRNGERHVASLPRATRNGPLADPANAVSVDLARKIASGEISPEQVAQLDEKVWKTSYQAH